MRDSMRPLLLLFVAAVLLAPATTYAQTIAGVVRDSSNAVMPGVTVEVTSPALIEKVRSTVTDDCQLYGRLPQPVTQSGSGL